MICNKLTYLEAPFTILKAPNPMGQPARLEKLSSKLRSDGTTLSLSQKRPTTFRHSDLDELGDPEERTPASAKYTEEDLQIMTKFCMDSFLQAQTSCPEPAG